MKHGFTGRVLYAVIYAALQAFIAACAAWLTARLLGSALVYTAKRAAVRAWTILGWAAARFLSLVAAATVEPILRAGRNIAQIAAEARDAVVMRQIEGVLA